MIAEISLVGILEIQLRKKNKTFHGNKHSDMFNCIINSFELRDLALNGGRFTWSNQENPTLERLDRILMRIGKLISP